MDECELSEAKHRETFGDTFSITVKASDTTAGVSDNIPSGLVCGTRYQRNLQWTLKHFSLCYNFLDVISRHHDSKSVFCMKETMNYYFSRFRKFFQVSSYIWQTAGNWVTTVLGYHSGFHLGDSHRTTWGAALSPTQVLPQIGIPVHLLKPCGQVAKASTGTVHEMIVWVQRHKL